MTKQTDEQYEKIRLELRRGALSIAVLASLHEPQYGYSVRKRLADAGLEIDEGTLYPLLRRLEDQGLLLSEWREADSRQRRYYRLDKAGRSVLAELRREWKSLDSTLAILLERHP
jgi:PadR family transcriptional regulator, regulatory protein PadR